MIDVLENIALLAALLLSGVAVTLATFIMLIKVMDSLGDSND
jgi:hypothetical protein